MILRPRLAALLTGQTWRMLSVNNLRRALVSVLSAARLDVTFAEGGAMGGSTGRNTYPGRYTITGG